MHCWHGWPGIWNLRQLINRLTVGYPFKDTYPIPRRSKKGSWKGQCSQGFRDFPGSPVVRTLHFHCREHSWEIKIPPLPSPPQKNKSGLSTEHLVIPILLYLKLYVYFLEKKKKKGICTPKAMICHSNKENHHKKKKSCFHLSSLCFL